MAFMYPSLLTCSDMCAPGPWPRDYTRAKVKPLLLDRRTKHGSLGGEACDRQDEGIVGGVRHVLGVAHVAEDVAYGFSQCLFSFARGR